MKIFILKGGSIQGPFEEQEVLDKVESGEFSEDDTAMTEGLETWTPLKAIIVKEPELSPLRARIVNVVDGVEGAAQRVRFVYSNHPATLGAVALLLGCVFMLLSQWPALIYGPFLAAAIVFGLLLLRWQRMVSGILILSFTIILPLTIWQLVLHKQRGLFEEKVTAKDTTVLPMQSLTPLSAPGSNGTTSPPVRLIDGLVPPPEVIAAEATTPAPVETATPSVKSKRPSASSMMASLIERTNAAATSTPTGSIPAPMAFNNNGAARRPTALESRRAAREAMESPTPEPKLPPAILAAVVTISGTEGAGTGFICNYHGNKYVATNQHVLGVGSPFAIRTTGNELIVPRQILAATDEDIVLIQCASIPAGIKPLEIASLPDASIQSGSALCIPGNSKGDGVITQTAGKLLAVGPQRIEVDNPVYPGNSGSPIIDVSSGKVIGMLTEAELVTLNRFEKESFRSKNSSIKSEIRYFGYRLDAVQQWEPLNWEAFQQTENLLKQSRDELDDIFAFFTDSSDRYKNFQKLFEARNEAAIIYKDKNHSIEDKIEAYNRFLRAIASFARTAKGRLNNQKIYFCQQNSVDTIYRMSDGIAEGTDLAAQDNDLFETLLLRGNGRRFSPEH